jgi:hypothetical protein
MYRYIEGAYGKKYTAGQIVRLDEYGMRLGTVKKPKGDPQYVDVEWLHDGKLCRGNFHPNSLTVVES